MFGSKVLCRHGRVKPTSVSIVSFLFCLKCFLAQAEKSLIIATTCQIPSHFHRFHCACITMYHVLCTPKTGLLKYVSRYYRLMVMIYKNHTWPYIISDSNDSENKKTLKPVSCFRVFLFSESLESLQFPSASMTSDNCRSFCILYHGDFLPPGFVIVVVHWFLFLFLL